MPTDPVCGMRVAEDGPLSTEHGGETYHFCSEHCLHKFETDPTQYAHGASGASHDHGEHASHHQPEAETPRAGSCSHCAGHSETVALSPAAEDMQYTCPMHPEVVQEHPGSCPKCGMALEPMDVPVAATRTEYVCPMHPEVVQDHPGSCPKCGMALEPREATVEEENPELDDMSRRFRVSAALALPVFLLAMIADLAPQWLPTELSIGTVQWIEFALATPVVLWGGWPFFVRGWQSVVTRNLNMFTLIGLGVGVAWTYSVIALLFPGIFPPNMQHEGGTVPVYFEAAAVITALVLLGQVLELRARSRTNAAIKLLLGLAPQDRPSGARRWH